MRIRKYNKNKYIKTENNIWVRDFTDIRKSQDINKLYNLSEVKLFLMNEFMNSKLNLNLVEDIRSKYDNVVIVSDGYDFSNKHKILSDLPSALILGVNGALKKWELVGEKCPSEKRRNMYYIVNNPYKECMNYFPNNKFFPNCFASLKTNPNFIKNYKGEVYRYISSPILGIDNMQKDAEFFVDDYRNSVCAALYFAHIFEAKKILLLCCDDAFEKERPGSVSSGKGTWFYPQQNTSHNIIDIMCYWLMNQENKKIQIKDSSGGPYYNNVEYINSDKDIIEFFNNYE